MRANLFLYSSIGLLLLFPLATMAASAQLTVAEQRQTFEAFGCSVNPRNQNGSYPNMSATGLKRLITDTNLKAIRIWGGPGSAGTIKSGFKDNGQYQQAVDRGVEIFLLGPGGYNGNPEGWGRAIANHVASTRGIGVNVTATGVQNEPGCGRQRDIPPGEGARMMQAARQALDAKGLDEVTLLSPEFCANDDRAKTWVRKVGEDAEATAAYDAVGTHSYNSGADEAMWDLVKRYDKEWWQTEAGELGHLLGLNTNNFDGSDAGARFLGDINTGVTHFFWFKCACASNDLSDHCVVQKDGTTRRNYPYLKLIANAFLPGTKMYHVTSDLPGHTNLHWGHHRDRPPIMAASGVRPDGTWVIGIVNLSRDLSTRKGDFWPKDTYTIELTVPQLSSVASLPFEVCRHGKTAEEQCGETMVLTNGTAQVTLAQSDLITLVARQSVDELDSDAGTSDSATGITGTGGSSAGACNLIQRGAQIPQGFAAPYNVLSAAQEMLISVTCPSTSSGQATLSAGTGAQNQYVYNFAYTWRQNQWQQIPLSGLNLQGGAWYVGRAQGTLPQTAAELNRNNFVVGYVCTWTPSTSSGQAGQWKCGCRDQACTQGLWQLQVFRR